MSCSCGQINCGCSPQPPICCTPTVQSIEYTFENSNLVGVGVLEGVTGTNVQLRGIVSESVALTVTLDSGNNVIVLDFSDASLIAAIPDATTTQRGILETATDAEAIAKALNNKIVTPSNFAAMASTTSFAGLVELATEAETIAGISTTLAVTPAGLAAAGQLSGTTTFADAVARAAAVPMFAGQFGTQLDTDQGYVSYGTTAGDWNPLLTLGVTSTMLAATTLDLNLAAFTVTNGNFDFQGSVTSNFDGSITFGSSTIATLSSGTTLNISSGAVLQISGATIGAGSIIWVDAGGLVAEYPMSSILTNVNGITYGIPSGTLARTTFATYNGQTISNPPTQAEVQALDDAVVIVSRRLGALITDLIASLKPTP